MRPIQVPSGRHPFEVAVLLASVACGIALVVTDQRPASVTAAMPGGLQAVWEVGLIVSGVVGLTGVTWTGRLSTAMGVELIAMIVLGTVTSMYALAMWIVVGGGAIVAGSFVAAVSVASWARTWQIIRDSRRIARATQRGDTADVHLLVERDGP